MTSSGWSMVRIGYVVAALVIGLVGCHRTNSKITSDRSPAPAAAFTGPATLVRGGETFVGSVVDASTFQTCDQTSVTLQASDTLTPGGICQRHYDVRIVRPAQQALDAAGGGAAVINGLAVDANTAVATYVRGGETGQVLLVKSPAGWIAKTTTPGEIDAPTAAMSGVGAPQLRRLLTQLPFDVHATPLAPASAAP